MIGKWWEPFHDSLYVVFVHQTIKKTVLKKYKKAKDKKSFIGMNLKFAVSFYGKIM